VRGASCTGGNGNAPFVSIGREDTLLDQQCAQGDSLRQVHAQQQHRCATDGSSADDDGALPAEVTCPLVPAGMEQGDCGMRQYSQQSLARFQTN